MTGFVDDFGQSSFRQGLRTQFGVIGALMLRELQSRFGRQNIGYLWIIGEPMMLATVISVLHSLANTGIHAKGVDVFAFTLVGYNIFIIFRNVFNRSEHMLDHYSFLLYHNMIKPFDIVLGNSLAEMMGAICSFFILLGAGICFGVADFPARPLYFVFRNLHDVLVDAGTVNGNCCLHLPKSFSQPICASIFIFYDSSKWCLFHSEFVTCLGPRVYGLESAYDSFRGCALRSI